MRTSILLLCLATVLGAFAAGCVPDSENIAAFAPRTYPYLRAPALPDPVAHK